MFRAAGVVPLSGLYNTTTVASGSAVALTTGTTANIASKSLAPGTYLVWGIGDFTLAAATATLLQAALSVASATLPTQAGGSGLGTDPLGVEILNTTTLSATQSVTAGPTTLTIAATTTLYLVAQATFSAGTVSGYGTLNAIQINVA